MPASRSSDETGAREAGAGLPTLLFRWVVVSTPLAWGVWQTVVTSLALFQ